MAADDETEPHLKAGSDRRQGVSDAAGTDGYSDATHGKLAEEGPPTADAEPLRKKLDPPWWSQGDWPEKLKAEQDRLNRDFDRRHGGVPEINGDLMPVVTAPGRISRTRQVGMKLRAEDFAALKTAADLYGCAPSTLARILVNRAVRRVLAEEGMGTD